MAVEEQICEVPTNSVAETRCEGACVGKDVAAKSLACVDTAGEDFAELDDLEHVDVTGGTLIKHLPETAVNDHDHDEALDCDPLQPLHADQLNPETHLSASATPDKAREIDIVTQRIALLHEHLQKSNTHHAVEELDGRIALCRSVEDVAHLLLHVVKLVWDCHPTFSLWSNQDRSDLEKRCLDCTNVEIMAGIIAELEDRTGVDTPCDDQLSNFENSGLESEQAIKPEFEADGSREEVTVEEQVPASTSRYGRARAVPNFAKMVDPMAQRAHAEVPTPRAPPSSGGADDVQATATQNMIELVKVIVSETPKSQAQSPATGQDKFVGVRIKQNGFGAVIKKNHSEINLGTFATPEEAARAYDMAALICQGDRAKVNFLDSWDIVQKYETSAIREPFRDHKESQREQAAASNAARYHQLSEEAKPVEWTPQAYESVDTKSPSALGRLLNDFSDRFPFAAVRDLDPAVWEVFMERNATLLSFSEFGSQLLWLSSQISDAAMRDSWGLHQGTFEQGCKNMDQGDACVELLKEFDERGVDWEKVGSLWEIDDGEGGDGMSKRGSMKRKRSCDNEGRESMEDFLQLNWHILSDFEREGTPGLQLGIEPTLHLVRSHRQATKHVGDDRPKKLVGNLLAAKMEISCRRPEKSAKQGTDRKLGRDCPKEASAGGANKNKGMTCRFCGKVFTHAPAHLQHERAHLQQQETKNPSSRIFQHMSMGSSTKVSQRSTGRGGAPLSPNCNDGKALVQAAASSGKEIAVASPGVKGQDDCLVDPPKQDSLDEPDSLLARIPHGDENDIEPLDEDEVHGEFAEDDEDVGDDDADDDRRQHAAQDVKMEEVQECMQLGSADLDGDDLSGPVSPVDAESEECTL